MPNGLSFNTQELTSLASRSFIYSREGVLIITNKLKQDGFFKRPEVTQESWCRLMDNLLFYSKTSEQWSEIKGVVVLEKCTIRSVPQDEQGHWPFHLVWNDELKPAHWLQLATFTECDRVGWLEAIQLASHDYIKTHALALQSRLEKIIPKNANIDINLWRIQKGITLDLNEIPLCELSLSADNLLCDSFDESPSCYLEIHVKINGNFWIKYVSTEVIENNRNPRFIRTIAFRKSDGLDGESLVRITVKDVREKISNASVTLGSATVLLSTIQVTQRFRIAVKNSERRTVGFLTLNGWNFESSNKDEALSLEPTDVTPWRVYCHRRSQSLPITLNIKIKLPSHSEIADHIFSNIYHSTYRLHSDLGCEVTIHELMAESKLCYIIPHELLGIWIQHEKEMLQEVLCIGEMDSPWKTNQMELLNKHYTLYNYYNSALDNVNNLRIMNKSNFKQSCRKDDSLAEFIPVNLHVQRMWAHDYNLNKSGFYDIVTVGAFTAHCQKPSIDGGLFQMMQQSKNSAAPNIPSNPVQMASDAVQAIKQLRGEVVDTMSELLALAKNHKSEGMMPLAEQMIAKTKALLSLWDSGLVEEALRFIDAHKISSMFIENCENAKMMSMLKRMNLQLNLTDIMSPDLEDFATPSSPCDDHLQFLDAEAMTSSPSANYYQPSDEPEPWDLTQLNIEASVMCLVSKVKFFCGHCCSPAIRLRGQRSKNPIKVTRAFSNANIKNGGSVQKSTKGVTKPKTLALDLDANSNTENIYNIQNNNCSEGVVFPSDDTQNSDKKDLVEAEESNNVTQTDEISTKKSNRFTEGLNLDDVLDWASELRPSMRKLRQAMDGLLKGGRLAHAVLRLQQDQSVLHQTIALQVRRDVCYSQALTSLVTALLCWLWSTDIDFIVVLLKFGMGPLCYFEGLLTLHGPETSMWGDMVIAVEDLQTVTFQLIRWNHREIFLPQIKGSRTSLTVNLPVHPDLYSKLSNKHMKFSITPVFFNMGINAVAVHAESSGAITLQHKSNIDNFDRLNEYHLRYQKLNFPSKTVFDRASSRLKPVEEMMAKMKTLLTSKKLKNVELLQEASFITKGLNGIHIISCKSGKDRTSMSCTLEQCNILLRDYNLTRQEFRRALDCMRSEGCRRENTVKNINVRKYAFTKIEVLALPHDYRPPLGTYGSTQT